MTLILALSAAAVAGLAVLAWPLARVLAAARDLRAEVGRAGERLGRWEDGLPEREFPVAKDHSRAGDG